MRPPIEEALGWMYAEACNMLDRGEDLRKVEVPEILARFHKAFKEAQNVESSVYHRV